MKWIKKRVVFKLLFPISEERGGGVWGWGCGVVGVGIKKTTSNYPKVSVEKFNGKALVNNKRFSLKHLTTKILLWKISFSKVFKIQHKNGLLGFLVRELLLLKVLHNGLNC